MRHPDGAASTLRWLLLPAFALFATGCPGGSAPVAPAPGPTAAPLLTLSDYFSRGEEGVLRFLDAGAGTEERRLSDAVARARASVVRIRVNYGRTPSSYQTDHGTGFLVDGGRRVWTAGHVLAPFERDPDAEAVVAFPDGRTCRVRPIRQEFSGRAGEGADFGILEIADDAGAATGPGLPTGTLRVGGLVAVLGFPGRLGRNPAGLVVGDDHEKNNPLTPLTFIGRMGAGGAIQPVAGCIPEGGMSGGPVVDPEGRVVAIQASVSRHQAGEVLTYTINSVPVETVPR